MTAVTRCADAWRRASSMIKSSMMCSESGGHAVCTTNTSCSRTFSSILILRFSFENRTVWERPSGIARWWQISAARPGCEAPEKTLRLLGVPLMRLFLPYEGRAPGTNRVSCGWNRRFRPHALCFCVKGTSVMTRWKALPLVCALTLSSVLLPSSAEARGGFSGGRGGGGGGRFSGGRGGGGGAHFGGGYRG